MNITVRRAQLADGPAVAPLIIDAIGDIAQRITGETNPQAVTAGLIELFNREDNRNSHLNTYIADNNGQVAGILVIYGGDEAIQLDANLEKWLAAKNAPIQTIEVEARADEFYIDTLCVNSAFRGQGIGTILLNYAEKLCAEKGYKKLSLSVEQEKVRARQLYEKIGYVYAEPWMIIGEEFDHMIKEIH
ncbi:GNAT family N-acetyltransferase [Kurthia sibirica]|uniref:GNAT family N-acetyltransferase n=1 Tax=Kurthia sibirica TaxID=202750 RepID=A0A2U3AQ96_9BACL|nr:GNAT family N-acetyltransferase [Kurthia sibirica]PWI26697.1 GNAT family N-acetyltransferase [Kurthia sibirica]GEK32967.1 N-acetyltransferase [Kurthia sibirica]